MTDRKRNAINSNVFINATEKMSRWARKLNSRIDLLFFHRGLQCLVAMELKIGKFKPSYLGTLTSYLQILDAKVRKPHENPSIGIILCKSANKEFVELVIQGYKSPMGVATYTTSADMPEELRRALPDIEELKRVLNQETEKEKIVRT